MTKEFPDYCELTFRTEGGYLAAVLKPHWPGGVSGVTIGPGYDMGHRSATAIKADLKTAGLPDASIDKLAQCTGLTGPSAGNWVTSNGNAVEKLTNDMSMAIFTYVYPTYVARTKGIVKAWGGDWDAYPQKMKEVLVDLTYRGDLAGKHQAHLSPSIKSADYRAFRTAIHDHKYWQDHTNLNNMKDGSPNGRITARSAWLPESPGVDVGPTPAWSFPFQHRGGKEHQHGGLYTGSPSLSTAALPRALDGYYPVGASGIWHGGIHFDAGTGSLLKQRDGVRCLKDGEVVAYLVNKTYPAIEFRGNGARALYSTGFTLVRHRLECPSPPPPAPTAAPAKTTPAPAATAKTAPALAATSKTAPLPAAPAKPGPAGPAPPANALTFYSLYMHQLDYQGYTLDPKRARPAFWSESREYFVGEKAKDEQEVAKVEVAKVEEEEEDKPEPEPFADEPELLDGCPDEACWSEDVC